jgi:superfamily II DNA or RNA helicase
LPQLAASTGPTLADVGTFNQLITRLDSDSGRRGKEFERICKWFLAHDPVYSRRLEKIWLWNDWPGRWGADAGIDLVAEDKDGKLWAIQAKAYDPAYSVTREDINTFLAEAGRADFSFRLLIATTNLLGKTAKRTLDAQEKASSVLLLGDLEGAQVDWPESPSELRGKPLPPKQPGGRWAYQGEAMKAVLEGFQISDRGQLIMACGTGKTLVSLFIAEQLSSRRTLFLVPSLALLAQTLREWSANTKEGFDFLAVCSDQSVNDDDAAMEHVSDLGLPVTTKPEEIASFLRRRAQHQVVFATYQSSAQIAAAFDLSRVPAFDLAIADEAHRCAGRVSRAFSGILDPTAIRARKRLFMTATPRFFKTRRGNVSVEGEADVASMDNGKVFGPVLHRLSFAEAIDLKLLSPYRLVLMSVDDPTYRDWAEYGSPVLSGDAEVADARSLAGHIGLLKAMRDYDLRRVISFHSRVKRARDFASAIQDVYDWMPADERPDPKPWSDFVSGAMPAGRRRDLVGKLRATDGNERGLLANARCLAEGVDVPALDGVAFIDPKRAEVDIVQAVGRAMRRSSDDKVGTIVIPVFLASDEDPAVALDDSAFEPVWDVVTALRAHDELLGTRLDELRQELGRLGKGRKLRLPSSIEVADAPTVGEAFIRAFTTRLVQETTASWEYWFGLVQRFVEENGHARVPQTCVLDGSPVGRWVDKQRTRHANNTLYPERERQLQELAGWTWDPKTDQWEAGFKRLEEYVASHETSLMPKGYRLDGYPLGQWVIVQRNTRNRGALAPERALRLETLAHWTWDPNADKWEDGFRHLCKYVAEFGDVRGTRSARIEGFNLGGWINTQRSAHVDGSLSRDREERLEQLPGWTWDPYAELWEEGFQRVQEYIRINGHGRVPTTYQVDGYRLGGWVQTQRVSHNDRTLDPERESRLESLEGWTWDPRADLWEEGFRHLLAYVEANGTALVPAAYKTDCGYRLGAWVNTQRTKKANNFLAAERRRRLECVPGWAWKASPDSHPRR